MGCARLVLSGWGQSGCYVIPDWWMTAVVEAKLSSWKLIEAGLGAQGPVAILIHLVSCCVQSCRV